MLFDEIMMILKTQSEKKEFNFEIRLIIRNY